MGRQRERGLWLPRWASWLTYVLLSVLMTWPLARHLGTRLGGRDTDIFNVYWGNWWVREALLTGQNPYMTKHLLYPVGFDLTTFAFSPFLALLWMPLAEVMSPIVAYNVVVLATILLNCAAVDDLVRYLTGSSGAALVSGLTLGFAPCLVAERAAHLNLATMAWIPWAALLLTRLTREARMRDAALFAVTIGLSFLTRLHVGALVLMFSGVYFVGLLLVEWKRWSRLVMRRLLLAGLLSLLILSPLLLHLWSILGQPEGEGLVREGAGDKQTDLLAYILPPPQHPLLGSWTEPLYKQRFLENRFYWVFVGFVPLVLALYAGVSCPKEALPWLLTGLFFLTLALGPFLRLNGKVHMEIQLPYGLAADLFAAIGFDVPNRFNLAMMPALGVLVGLACAQISAQFSRSWPLFILAGLILFEYTVVPLPLKRLPSISPFYDQMAADGEDYAVVDLPLKRAEGEKHRYYQTIHHKPIVGGWDHRVSASAFAFIDENPLLGVWRKDVARTVLLPPALAGLSEANVRYIILHKDQLRGLPEGVRSLFLTLKPVYEDNSVYVLPTEVEPTRDFGIVHSFNESVELIRPPVVLAVDEITPTLLLDTCWLLQDKGRVADGCQVTLSDPDDIVIGRKSRSFHPSTQSPVCESWAFELVTPYQAGSYQIDITPLSGGRPLGAWSMAQPIQIVRDKNGTELPLMGYSFPVSFDAPVEMLGYNIETSDDVLWIDLYWRGLADHHQAYVLFVQLLDTVDREQVVRTSDDIIHELDWTDGKIIQERRILMVNDMPQGQYALSVGLYPAGMPNKRIAAFDQRSGERWPGAQVLLDMPVLALPRVLRDTPVSEEGRIVVYTAGSVEGSQAPQQGIEARFGDMARLTGYSLDSPQVTVGQDLEVTLYWEAINAQPVNADYSVFVHLLDGSSRVIAQHDGKPVRGTRPTYTWKSGDKIVDVHEIIWLTQEYTGVATIEAGLYDLQTEQRLPAFGGMGERLSDDRILLGQVTVLGGQ